MYSATSLREWTTPTVDMLNEYVKSAIPAGIHQTFAVTWTAMHFRLYYLGNRVEADTGRVLAYYLTPYDPTIVMAEITEPPRFLENDGRRLSH